MCLELDPTTLSAGWRSVFLNCKACLRAYSHFQIRLLATACSLLWLLGIKSLLYPGVSEYILSSWLPRFDGQGVRETRRSEWNTDGGNGCLRRPRELNLEGSVT